MSSYLLNIVANNAYMGIFFAFLFAFLEALPIIGTFIPGIALMSVVGYWVGANLISFHMALYASFIGALIGDYISYWIGIKYEKNIYEISYFKDKANYIDKAKGFVEKFGSLAILLGRFFGPVRSSVPLIAGLLSLNKLKFFIGVVPSAFLWSLLYLSPGIIYGSAAMFLPKHFFNLIFEYAVVILLITFYYRYQKHIASFVSKMTNKLIKKNISVYYVWLFLNFLVSWGLLCIIWYSVVNETGISVINKPIYFFLQSIRTQQLDFIMFIMTLFGEKNFIIPFIIVWVGYLAKNGRYEHIQHFMTMVFFTFILTHGVKLFASIERPPIGNLLSLTYSFPSGHTAIVVAIMSSIRWSCSSRKENITFLPSLFYTFIILATGFSRLYLGMHWFTDVIAAFLLVHPTILLTELLMKKSKKIQFSSMFKIFSIVTVIATVTSTFIFKDFEEIHLTSPLNHPKKLYNNNNLQNLPKTKFNRTHTYKTPLNFRYIGDLKTLDRSFSDINWTINSQQDKLFKPLIINDNHIENQLNPTIKPLLYHQGPVRVYAKIYQDKLYVLRLWTTPYYLKNRNIYLGSVYIDDNPTQPQMWLNPKRAFYDVGIIKSLQLKHTNEAIHDEFSQIKNWTKVIATYDDK
ncbi:MAG: bifunctional DedA family/phosphatase PAP2 family protein [Pseudomonadota bacterium]|nr:bifunctional DedA family/phosphatase PAP2 family protein [Pseudomonadota bacterium]